jgi:hypothetical protein
MWDSIPVQVRRNRDFSDLIWSLVCRNCSYAIDADGFCVCTASENGIEPENDSGLGNQPEPEKKRKIEAVYDLTGRGKPKVIDFLKK